MFISKLPVILSLLILNATFKSTQAKPTDILPREYDEENIDLEPIMDDVENEVSDEDKLFMKKEVDGLKKELGETEELEKDFLGDEDDEEDTLDGEPDVKEDVDDEEEDKMEEKFEEEDADEKKEEEAEEEVKDEAEEEVKDEAEEEVKDDAEEDYKGKIGGEGDVNDEDDDDDDDEELIDPRENPSFLEKIKKMFRNVRNYFSSD